MLQSVWSLQGAGITKRCPRSADRDPSAPARCRQPFSKPGSSPQGEAALAPALPPHRSHTPERRDLPKVTRAAGASLARALPLLVTGPENPPNSRHMCWPGVIALHWLCAADTYPPGCRTCYSLLLGHPPGSKTPNPRGTLM